MNSRIRFRPVAVCSLLGTAVVLAVAQVADFPDANQPTRRPEFTGRSFQPPPRGGGPRGGGGFGGVQADFALRKQFDKNGDKILDLDERKAAREFLQKERAEGRGPRRGPGRFGGRGEALEAPEGARVSAKDVRVYEREPFYDAKTVRTFFLEFEAKDWEQELDDFYHTDVEVPSKLTVDGKSYEKVGVQFHGASSFFTVPRGQKRSLVLSLDLAKEDQNLMGFRTIDLLNAHTDPTFLHTVLYLQVARDFIPAPRANFARVVINGESWGIYVNAEHFNKDFVKAHFPKSKGVRWKVPGSPAGQGGLEYLGEDETPYKRIYEIKTKDEPASWRDLIRLCRVLNKTETNMLEAELSKVLDVDGALKFLALENALINSDGYWIRSSDYSLCQDEKGRFHIIPHDANETFSPPERPRFGGGGDEGEGNRVGLNPFAGAENSSRPLLNRLLAVPELRARYAGYVRQIAEKWLDWKKLGPIAQEYHALIEADVKSDPHKLREHATFTKSLHEDVEEETFRGVRTRMSLKTFVEQRREFLLAHPEIKSASIPAKANR